MNINVLCNRVSKGRALINLRHTMRRAEQRLDWLTNEIDYAKATAYCHWLSHFSSDSMSVQNFYVSLLCSMFRSFYELLGL
ncbi:unnamed protein product [Auanema sp. JU1783]|nr:unnamed protein product [Auanema sp. JU1783]